MYLISLETVKISLWFVYKSLVLARLLIQNDQHKNHGVLLKVEETIYVSII